jgi:hypothetical protein
MLKAHYHKCPSERCKGKRVKCPIPFCSPLADRPLLPVALCVPCLQDRIPEQAGADTRSSVLVAFEGILSRRGVAA